MNRRLPALNAKEMVAALKQAGFSVEHQRGSHVSLFNLAINLHTVVPMHPGDLDRSLMKKILKQARLSEDEFRRLL